MKTRCDEHGVQVRTLRPLSPPYIKDGQTVQDYVGHPASARHDRTTVAVPAPYGCARGYVATER